MVDINLEAVNGDSLPKDLYLSLRVGEQQKFAKANNSGRTFKFSTPEDKRVGKLEIYRRVGVAAISLDHEKFQEAHELAVAIDDERVAGKEVKYRFCLGGHGSIPTSPKAEGAEPAKQVSAKVSVAKDYLQKHQLEQRLSEAMQAVLREQPDDPGTFLAQRLTSGAGMLKKADEPLKMMQTTQVAQTTQATLSQACKAVPTASAQDVTAMVGALSKEGQQKLDTVLSQATLSQACKDVPAASAQDVTAVLGALSKEGQQKLDTVLSQAAPAPAAASAPAASSAAPVQAATTAAAQSDMGVQLDLPVARDYPMPTMADKDPISTATLMIGPGMCNYANVGRPGIMIF